MFPFRNGRYLKVFGNPRPSSCWRIKIQNVHYEIDWAKWADAASVSEALHSVVALPYRNGRCPVTVRVAVGVPAVYETVCAESQVKFARNVCDWQILVDPCEIGNSGRHVYLRR